MNDAFEVVPLRPEPNAKFSAADWLAKLDRGDLTPDERANFEKWLAEDQRNREEIKEVADFWYGLNAPLSHIGGEMLGNANLAGANISLKSRAASMVSALAGRMRVLVAAGALGMLAVFSYLSVFSSNPADASGYFSTKIGESKVIALSDGSTITLNTNSVLEQDFSREKRIIRLVSGEAIFDVAHDELRPFLVYAVDGVIRAVGTRFSVRVEPENVSVTVTEGRIELRRRLPDDSGDQDSMSTAATTDEAGETLLKPAPPVIVSQGEAGEIRRIEGASKQKVTPRDVMERLAWANGQLVFYDRELQSVIDEVERYAPVSIRIEDEELKQRKITGVIQIGDVDTMLDAIVASLGVNAERISPGLIYLRPA